jgi:hypothetical protein
VDPPGTSARATAGCQGQATRRARQQRAQRQSQRWVKALQAIGTPPAGARWVPVADREGAIFPCLQSARASDADFWVRLVQNRRWAEWTDDTPRELLDSARQRPAMRDRTLDRPAKPGQPARPAQLSVSGQPVTRRSPRNAHGTETLRHAWVVRTWEAKPPPPISALSMAAPDGRARRVPAGCPGADRRVDLPLDQRGLP